MRCPHRHRPRLRRLCRRRLGRRLLCRRRPCRRRLCHRRRRFAAAAAAAIAAASAGLVLHPQVKQLQRKLAHDSVWARGLLGLLPITAAAALVVFEHTQCVVGERPGHRQPAELVELGDEPAATHLHHRECGEQHGVTSSTAELPRRGAAAAAAAAEGVARSVWQTRLRTRGVAAGGCWHWAHWAVAAQRHAAGARGCTRRARRVGRGCCAAAVTDESLEPRPTDARSCCSFLLSAIGTDTAHPARRPAACRRRRPWRGPLGTAGAAAWYSAAARRACAARSCAARGAISCVARSDNLHKGTVRTGPDEC